MENNSEVVYLYLDDIIPNRFQPREVFDDQALKELAVSIKEHGVIQPIIVRQVENKYEIIAGERRYKASTMAGLTKIPAIVKNLDDKESSKVALIENLQRKDLTPIEEARTFQKILEDGMTQEQLAATMGKTQSSVSNKLRLLALPEEIQDALLKEKLSERHARSLLNVEDKNEQIKLMDRVIAEKMTVRELDKVIKEMQEGSGGQEKAIEQPTSISAPESSPSNMNLENSSVFGSSNPTSPPAEEKKEDNSLSASDILKEDSGEKSIMNTFQEIKKSLNPTEVDINQIKENAVDIGGNKPAEETKAETSATEQKNDEFKFVPTFGSNYMNNNQEKKEESPVENNFSKYFNSSSDSNVAGTTSENNNVASSMNSSVTMLQQDKKDVSKAVSDIKSTVDNLKNSGYDVSMEETDELSNYKVTISIKKDA